MENQIKAWLPTNNDTRTITYNDHFVISDNPFRRVSWEVSKREDTTTWGLTKLTFTQEQENDAVDNLSWINTTSENYSETEHGIEYDFYLPRTNDKPMHTPTDPLEVDESVISFSGVKQSLKVGGSYKTYTANFYNSGKFIDMQPRWTVSYIVEGIEICSLRFEVVGTDIVPYVNDSNFNLGKDRKIKYVKDGKELFGIQYIFNADKKNDLKLKCLSNFNMIGNSIVIKAEGIDSGIVKYSASLEVEVEGL